MSIYSGSNQIDFMQSEILKNSPLSGATLSRMLGVHPNTLAGWARVYDDFPCIKMPGKNSYFLSEVQVWLDARPKRVGYSPGRKKKEVTYAK